MSTPRIAVLHQGCIPTYRKPFYERLAALGQREYVVFHGDSSPDSGLNVARPPFRFPNVPVRNRYLRVFGRTLTWQPVIRAVLRGGFDALVIGHELKYVANLVLLLLFRVTGKPALFWGFGPRTVATAERRNMAGRFLDRAVATTKTALIRAASGFLVYAPKGAEFVVRAGMPRRSVFVLNNTIEIEGEIAAYTAAQTQDPASLRRKQGLRPDSVVLMFIGRLTAEKEVSLLLDAVSVLDAVPEVPPVEVVIVGEGPERAALEAAARGLKWCHFLGFIGESERLAPLFRVASAVVIPGYVGLSVNHAFAHGVPVITRDIATHSPEIEYLAHGINGLLLPPDPAKFRDGLAEFVRCREMQERFAAGALATRSQLDLGRMVETFDAGVAAALSGGQRT